MAGLVFLKKKITLNKTIIISLFVDLGWWSWHYFRCIFYALSNGTILKEIQWFLFGGLRHQFIGVVKRVKFHTQDKFHWIVLVVVDHHLDLLVLLRSRWYGFAKHCPDVLFQEILFRRVETLFSIDNLIWHVWTATHANSVLLSNVIVTHSYTHYRLRLQISSHTVM